MKVTFSNGKSYKVSWMHTHYGTPTKNITHLTRCVIEDLDHQKGSLARGIGTGTAECSKRDKFVKDTGRKVSLSRARAATVWGKDIRAAFWREYIERKPAVKVTALGQHEKNFLAAMKQGEKA